MKKVLDTVKNALAETTGLFGEGYDNATQLLKDTLTNFYDVKNLTKEKLVTLANDLIALSPIIEEAGFRTKEINVGVTIPPRIVFHFEKFRETSREEIDALLKRNSDKHLLKVIINTLVSADDFQKKLTLGRFVFGEIDIEVGVPPVVNVKLLNP